MGVAGYSGPMASCISDDNVPSEGLEVQSGKASLTKSPRFHECAHALMTSICQSKCFSSVSTKWVAPSVNLNRIRRGAPDLCMVLAWVLFHDGHPGALSPVSPNSRL